MSPYFPITSRTHQPSGRLSYLVFSFPNHDRRTRKRAIRSQRQLVSTPHRASMYSPVPQDRRSRQRRIWELRPTAPEYLRVGLRNSGRESQAGCPHPLRIMVKRDPHRNPGTGKEAHNPDAIRCKPALGGTVAHDPHRLLVGRRSRRGGPHGGGWP